MREQEGDCWFRGEQEDGPGSLGVDDVTGEDVGLQIVAELPPGHQLHVDLVAPLHLQDDHLKHQ